MDDQKSSENEEDFMDFKDPFFEELDKIKSDSVQNLGETMPKASEHDEVHQGIDQKPTIQSSGERSHVSHASELRAVLTRIATDVSRALTLLKDADVKGATITPQTESTAFPSQSVVPASLAPVATGTIIEGVFDGVGMIGNYGKHYSMPANYASKSKLVEGDTLKLTISPEGSFIYKQIHPIERKRVMGVLSHDAVSRQFTVAGEGRLWKVLTASVTYFKGMAGDEAVILVPQDHDSAWAAVEHIIKKY